MTPSGPAQPPAGPQQPGGPLPGAPAAGPGFDRSRLGTADVLVAGGALLYVLVGFLPWASVDFDFVGRITASGYEYSGLVVLGALLLLAAGAWAVLPAVRQDRVGPLRAAPTVVLAALALLCTLIAWLRSADYGFQLPALLGVLLAAAVTVLAALSLLPGLRDASVLRSGPVDRGEGDAGGRSPQHQPAPGYGPPAAPEQPQYGRLHYGQPVAFGQSQYAQPQHEPPQYGRPEYGQPETHWQRPTPAPPAGGATAEHPADPDRPRPAADR
ncbi:MULTISPECIES: hypothetical protein [unclassified Modestobacter]|uniref:hypothetical protein n=1 Tax=unclassified Modestobacter TaxID=2643866 RepID=UPI0022AB2446|nr:MULTISPECIES: hypothetical protein [unclassified Modestobacter]MCZ2823696.1 hypothetical protein [Modestobacter sp. VKM Ac-2981]MCZ2851941.1 hypothetical protein [Modestobacter sp. VKM Ac-2982]